MSVALDLLLRLPETIMSYLATAFYKYGVWSIIGALLLEWDR
jgi:hypothetical protein